MISRFSYVKPKKRDFSKDDEFETYEYIERIRVISTNKDGSVDKYVKECVWVSEKSSWKDFIKSYDLGSVSKQVLDHLTKGTPLVTAHTLPPADYTKLGKGAEIKREMEQKGITLDMVKQAISDMFISKKEEVKKEEVKTQEGGAE